MRTCGECVVCCVYPSINEDGLRKEALAPCPNLWGGFKLTPPIMTADDKYPGMPLFTSEHYALPVNENCEIYNTRPECCSEYRCAWLEGYGSLNQRPDKVGVVFDKISPAGEIGNAIIAKPLWFGAEDEEKGLEVINQMSREMKVPVLVLQFTEFKLLRVVGRGSE